MANTFTHTIISCSLILLVLAFSSFSTSHGSSAVLQNVCNQTKHHFLCLTVLGSDPGSKTAGLAQLAQIAIDMAEYEAVGTKVKIHELLMAALKDPKSEALYVNCENLYLDALAALRVAPDYLAQHQYGDLRAQGALVRYNVGHCGASLIVVKPQFAKEIREVGILGDAIAIIAKDLSH